MSLQSVLITGANRGIGLEFVRQLLISNSPPIYVIATTRQSSNEELEELKTMYPMLHILKLEIKNFNEFEDFAKNVKQIVGDFGVDTLINNAGIIIRHDLDQVTSEEMVENFEVNTVAPLMLTKALLPSLKESSTKRLTAVVNISSRLGSIELNGRIEGIPYTNSYPGRTSRSALNMVSKCLSIDLKEDRINVISLHPGWVQTSQMESNAHLTVSASVSTMLNTINCIDNQLNGRLVNYDGNILPW